MFLETAHPITENDIKQIEEKLNISIPRQFVEHYMSFNGGKPEDKFLYSKIADIEAGVQSFLPMKYKDVTGYTIESMYDNFVSKNVIPANYLPFALDFGSNLYCINLTTNEIVIIWMDVGNVTEEEICVLFEDFNTFISSLEAEEWLKR